MRIRLYHVLVWLATGLGPIACARPSVTDRALSLARTGHTDEAIAALEKRLAEAPDDLPARRALVRVYAYAGDLPHARAQVEALKKQLAADDPSPYLDLGSALELAHRFDEALAAYDDAARVAPTSPAGPRAGGLRAAKWGEADVAEERLEEAVRRGARDDETLHALALAKMGLRDFDGAEVAYKAALAANPKALENLLGLASLALAREDFANALVYYTQLRDRRPDHASAELGRAYALARLGRNGEARASIDRAEQLGAPPTNVAKLRQLTTSGSAPNR